MKQLILILLVLLNFSNAYAEGPGISLIELYIKNDQSDDHRLASLSFEKTPLLQDYFDLFKYGSQKDKSILKDRLINFQEVFDKHQCSITVDEAFIRLTRKNVHNKVLKATYKGDIFIHYYAEPLQIDGCNLVIDYKEIISKHDPRDVTGYDKGFLMLFELRKNQLYLILSEGIMHVD